jgi:hypothetical protein
MNDGELCSALCLRSTPLELGGQLIKAAGSIGLKGHQPYRTLRPDLPAEFVV